jgi:hypothetical protein
MKKWTKEEFQGHLRVNTDYGSAVVVAALYHKIYGEFPEIGLSGHQGSGAEYLLKVMPSEPNNKGDE